MGAWALGAPLVVLLMLAMVLWVTERRVQSQGTSR
jgi:hypothetical protein